MRPRRSRPALHRDDRESRGPPPTPGVPRSAAGGDAARRFLLRDVGHAAVHAGLERSSRHLRDLQRRVRRHAAPGIDDLVHSWKREAELLGERRLRDPIGLRTPQGIAPGYVGGRCVGSRRCTNVVPRGLVVVRDLDLAGIAILPLEADAVLPIDAETVLPTLGAQGASRRSPGGIGCSARALCGSAGPRREPVVARQKLNATPNRVGPGFRLHPLLPNQACSCRRRLPRRS